MARTGLGRARVPQLVARGHEVVGMTRSASKQDLVRSLGARPVVADTILALLNAGITPVVREYGSLGCSGDLAPLAHCALAWASSCSIRSTVAGGKLAS